MPTFPNGKPAHERLDAFLAAFTCFELLPTRPEPDADGFIETCSADEAVTWTIYGRLPDGEALVVHDAEDPRHAAGYLIWLFETTGRSVAVIDPSREKWGFTPQDIADLLACAIHDEIPGHDDPEDFREDDSESHPLAPLREAFVDGSGYSGGIVDLFADAPDLKPDLFAMLAEDFRTTSVKARARMIAAETTIPTGDR